MTRRIMSFYDYVEVDPIEDLRCRVAELETIVNELEEQHKRDLIRVRELEEQHMLRVRELEERHTQEMLNMEARLLSLERAFKGQAPAAVGPDENRGQAVATQKPAATPKTKLTLVLPDKTPVGDFSDTYTLSFKSLHKDTTRFAALSDFKCIYVPNILIKDQPSHITVRLGSSGKYRFKMLNQAKGDDFYCGEAPWKNVYMPQKYRKYNEVFLTIL